jgi:hypothetical protein
VNELRSHDYVSRRGEHQRGCVFEHRSVRSFAVPEARQRSPAAVDDRLRTVDRP